LGRYLKLLISCAFYVASRPFLKVSDLLGLRTGAPLIILYYHDISETDRAGFARQMDMLMRRTRVVDASWRGKSNADRLCAITFDDALAGVVTNALPELAIRSLPCTIFVPVGNLGRPPAWTMESHVDRNVIVVGPEIVQSLPTALVKVGTHSISHPYLSRIPRESARFEIEQSRFILSSIVDDNVSVMSFPYGDHDREIIKMCQQAGYDMVFGIKPTPVDPMGDAFVRGRVAVEPNDGSLEFFLKISGAYRWIPLASAVKQIVKVPFSAIKITMQAGLRRFSRLETRREAVPSEIPPSPSQIPVRCSEMFVKHKQSVQQIGK
jgi:peptidoglycan/xylan/chitin deacetylase (PgdA/CDA1 family)